MVESPSITKNDEQFPLLMVAGAGDAVLRAPAPPTSLWNTPPCTVTSRRWTDRWPEYLSTCWMTFILIGISFLVFYAIGMVMVYKHDAYILVKCNDSKPATDVFYHNVIPRGMFPLTTYAGYLADVATKYPALRFNVYFLVDDSQQQVNFYSKLQPFNPYFPRLMEEYNVYNRREVRDFQKKYPNVNISVMALSKYMATTPLKYKWRCIPVSRLPFYARVFSVWRYGGVGLDLVTYNDHHRHRRTNAILKQHNDGVTSEKYIETLMKLEHEEETEFFSGFFNMVQRMFNETISMFNRTVFNNLPMENEVNVREKIARTRPLKREVSLNNQILDKNGTNQPSIVNIVLANSTVVNITSDTNKENIYQISTEKANASTDSMIDNITMNNMEPGLHIHKLKNDSKGDEIVKVVHEPVGPAALSIPISPLFINEPPYGPGLFNEFSNTEKKNKSDRPQMILFYDVSIVSEKVRPQQDLAQPHASVRSAAIPSNIVVVDYEGSLVAATGVQHPFLANLISIDCKKSLPKLVINNAILSQCSGMLRDDTYCNSIYVF